MRTQTTANHAALVYAFLVKYFGTAIGVVIESPLPTATGKDRFPAHRAIEPTRACELVDSKPGLPSGTRPLR